MPWLRGPWITPPPSECTNLGSTRIETFAIDHPDWNGENFITGFTISHDGYAAYSASFTDFTRPQQPNNGVDIPSGHNIIGIEWRDDAGHDVPGGPYVHVYIGNVVAYPGIQDTLILRANHLDVFETGFSWIEAKLANVLYWTSPQIVEDTNWALLMNSNLPLEYSLPGTVMDVRWVYQPSDYRFIYRTAPPLQQRQRSDGLGGGPSHAGRGIATRQHGIHQAGVY